MHQPEYGDGQLQIDWCVGTLSTHLPALRSLYVMHQPANKTNALVHHGALHKSGQYSNDSPAGSH